MSTVNEIAEASKGCAIRYMAIEYQGVKLLTTTSRLWHSISITWELTHDPAVEKLAEELGMELHNRYRYKNLYKEVFNKDLYKK